MKIVDKGRVPFLYLLTVTVISVLLVLLNVLLGMSIPFHVSFLVGYVGASLVFVAWHAILTKGWKRSLVMFSLSFGMAFIAEALGVNFGLVFGHYYYTPMLGPSLFGVPLLAALAWEPIVYAAFCLSELLASRGENFLPSMLNKTSPLWVAAIGALATTAWDMMIDPIAVSQGWWVWVNGGSYVPYVANGVPITNFLGWLLVAFLINLAYRWVAHRGEFSHSSPALSFYGPLTLYGSLFLSAFGVSLTILKRPEVALIGVVAMGPFIILTLANLPYYLSLRSSFQATVTKS
jgi:uncharacterized membrane protein